ncbi:hypothetical protein SDC9_208557 [bioreactor metagenome]|uniref:Uncharacterized protein n=1 Tax=bioreactor metagenome TaxID=1076179 RepID=A0A645JAX6_9ZZZZ
MKHGKPVGLGKLVRQFLPHGAHAVLLVIRSERPAGDILSLKFGHISFPCMRMIDQDRRIVRFSNGKVLHIYGDLARNIRILMLIFVYHDGYLVVLTHSVRYTG